ncbi:MAG: hypothetical protein ACT4OQ_05980 [Chloroflexota bacterium]
MTTSQTPSPGPSRGAEPSRSEPGYRGSLPSREDRLARPWILVVVGIFILVIALSIAGIPSRFIPEPTAPPLPSLPPASGSVESSPSGSAAASASASAEPSASPEASPSVE